MPSLSKIWLTSHPPESLQEEGAPESPPISLQESPGERKLGSPPAFLVISTSKNNLQQINQFFTFAPSEGCHVLGHAGRRDKLGVEGQCTEDNLTTLHRAGQTCTLCSSCRIAMGRQRNAVSYQRRDMGGPSLWQPFAQGMGGGTPVPWDRNCFHGSV